MKIWNPECTLGENFPSHLRSRKGAQDYVQTFLAAFNQAHLNQGEQHVLRTSCLLAIPPPSPGAGGIIITPPADLSMIGLMELALYVEDLASGMGTLSPHVVENTNVICNRLLPHLEGLTGVPRCPRCLYPQGGCCCSEKPLQMSYSQLQTAPPAFTTLAGGTTAMIQSTASRTQALLTGMTPLAPPSTVPGTVQSMEWTPTGQPAFPTPLQATTPQSYHTHPQGGHGGMPHTTAATPAPLRQTHPSTQSASRLSTPYQPQVKVPKSVSFGKNVIPAGAESSHMGQPTYASKASQPHSRGRESRRDMHEGRTPSTGYGGPRSKGREASQKPQSQSGTSASTTLSARAKRIVEIPRPPHEHDSAGWNRNVERILDYFLYQEVASLSPTERAIIVDKVLAKMDELDEMKLWFFKRERQPLSFMSYLAEVVDRMSGHHLTDIRLYTRWIRPGSYYHLRILEREELNRCPHLQHVGPPRSDVELPSITSLRTHKRSFELLDADPQTPLEAFRKARHNLWKSLILHGKAQEAREVSRKKFPSGRKLPPPPPP